ncbi:MAG: serine/threonine protein kinase, partial [Oscillospiraceae bacterium]|nr:serine/threonine protein kinase [Oscillospiraceae bacterium]
GITYVGYNQVLSMKVAIKEYYPNNFASRTASMDSTVYPLSGEKGETFESGKKKFIDEAKRLARFTGLPGIVEVKDFFEENNTAYIVMEFIEGSTLKHTLEQMGGSMPESHVLEMMKPLVKSLAEIHKVGVIHRDIAPDNIMLQYPDGNVKLLDFGAAREIDNSGNSTMAIAKHGYAPEEQYDPGRDRNGTWTDVYALCATMFHAIEGTPPPNAYERMRVDEFKGFTAPVSLNTANVIMKGLAVYAEHRWQNMAELSAALYSPTGVSNPVIQTASQTSHASHTVPIAPEIPQIVSDSYTVPVAPEMSQTVLVQSPKSNRNSGKKKAFIGIAVALALFVGVGAYFLFFRGDDVVPASRDKDNDSDQRDIVTTGEKEIDKAPSLDNTTWIGESYLQSTDENGETFKETFTVEYSFDNKGNYYGLFKSKIWDYYLINVGTYTTDGTDGIFSQDCRLYYFAEYDNYYIDYDSRDFTFIFGSDYVSVNFYEEDRIVRTERLEVGEPSGLWKHGKEKEIPPESVFTLPTGEDEPDLNTPGTDFYYDYMNFTDGENVDRERAPDFGALNGVTLKDFTYYSYIVAFILNYDFKEENADPQESIEKYYKVLAEDGYVFREYGGIYTSSSYSAFEKGNTFVVVVNYGSGLVSLLISSESSFESIMDERTPTKTFSSSDKAYWCSDCEDWHTEYGDEDEW